MKTLYTVNTDRFSIVALFKLLFIFLFLLELFLFVEIGSQIGGWTTIFWVIGTALAGFQTLRFYGMTASYFSYYSMVRGADPSQEVVNSFAIIMGAILLMIPGFLTDVIGLLCLLPLLRRYLIAKFVTTKKKGGGSGGGPSGRRANKPDDTEVIEGEYRRHR